MDTILLPGVWTVFTSYLLFYMLVVKRSAPITADEAKVLWKIHKKSTHCPGQKWLPITRKGGRLEGFECECGYHYSQKKPILAGSYKTSKEVSISPFDPTV